MPQDDTYSISGETPTASKLLRIFLAATIIDNGGTLTVSRRALADLSDDVNKHRGFQIIAYPGDESGMELSMEWYD